MRMTSKGQVTVPKAIRDQFDLRPGSEVEFVEVGGKVVLQALERDENAVAEKRGDDFVAAVEKWHGRGRGVTGLSADEILAETRGVDIPLPKTPPTYTWGRTSKRPQAAE